MSGSWGAANQRNRDRENAARAAAEQQRKAAVAEYARQVSLHEAGIAPINRLVDEFIRAVRQAGSPELLVKKEGRIGHVKAHGFKGWRKGMWYAQGRGENDGFIVEVHTDGDWTYKYYSAGVQGIGPGGDVWPSTNYLCHKKLGTNQKANTPENYTRYTQGIQEVLAQFLKEHHIPLPRS